MEKTCANCANAIITLEIAMNTGGYSGYSDPCRGCLTGLKECAERHGSTDNFIPKREDQIKPEV